MARSLHGQHVIVVGAGRSGIAAVDLALAQGAVVTLADTTETVAGADALRARRVHLDLGPQTSDAFLSADLVVLSPGVPADAPAVQAARAKGISVIGEIELAFRYLPGRVIAVTGTKGKSTTTTLIARMLAEGGFTVTAGGNLGTALATQVADSTPETLHVVETSSFQLETIETFHPWVSVALNLSPDHLDRHGTFEAYAAAKARIYERQTADDWAVVNADDPGVLAMARAGRARQLRFSVETAIDEGVLIDAGTIVRRAGGTAVPLVRVGALRLPGRHVVSNVAAAAAVASIVGVAPDAITRAVERFEGLPHALQPVATIGGVTFVNDSKATNIASARRALESFDAGVVAIVGGRHKGGRFEDLRDVVAARCAGVVAIGEAAPAVVEAFADLVPVESTATMADAVRAAARLVPAGGTVVLAPACASFDMFRDYAARGEAFVEEVHRLEDGQSSALAPR